MLGSVNRAGALAILALVASLASSSYAAGVRLLASASVGSTQLRGSAVTTEKIATGAVTAHAVRGGALLRADLTAAASAGVPGTRGTSGTAGPAGLAGARGPAGPAGAKGATGDQGSAPKPSYLSVGTVDSVFVAANDESTGTIACPAGMRVLSGDASPIGAGTARLTVVASEPNPAGTGWIMTMRAADQEAHFQLHAICVLVQ